jgi:hypothetical protein
MDQLLEGFFIAAERVGAIEICLTLAADRTPVVFIQRIGIRERRLADFTEEFGL